METKSDSDVIDAVKHKETLTNVLKDLSNHAFLIVEYPHLLKEIKSAHEFRQFNVRRRYGLSIHVKTYLKRDYLCLYHAIDEYNGCENILQYMNCQIGPLIYEGKKLFLTEIRRPYQAASNEYILAWWTKEEPKPVVEPVPVKEKTKETIESKSTSLPSDNQVRLEYLTRSSILLAAFLLSGTVVALGTSALISEGWFLPVLEVACTISLADTVYEIYHKNI